MTELLKKLMNTAGISGRESRVAELIEKEASPFCDEIYRDRLGNLYAHRSGNGKKILFCAHMDEIGFFVTNIEANGFLRIAPIGKFALTGLLYSKVVLEGGARGVLVPEEGVSDFEKCERLYVDIGADSQKAAERKASPGDFITLAPALTRISGNRYAGRPFDGRAGCAALIAAMRSLENCRNDICFAFSTHEEVGNRGALPIGCTVSPDYAIAVDLCPAGDVPGATKGVKLGGGAAIKLKDGSLICDHELAEKLKETADRAKIKYQPEISATGFSDASALQKSGIGAVVGGISIPARHIHSALEIIDLSDLKQASALINEIACAL